MSHHIDHSRPLEVEGTFFGKVMMFFALAILISAGGTFISAQYFMSYFIAMPALIYVLYAVELILIFTSHFWSTKAPLNRLIFAAFAFITGVTISPLIVQLTSSAAGTALLFKALAITGAMFGATAIFGYITNINLSGLRGFLLIALIGMIVTSIVGIFVPWGNSFEMYFAGFGVILFSAFVAYDFQKLKEYPEDRYIDAALNLYLDIFNLFLYVLRFLMAFTNRD